MGTDGSYFKDIDTEKAFEIIALAEMAQAAVIASNAATFYC